MTEFLNAGAPIDAALIKEGTSSSTSSGGIAMPSKLAHPNATKVFLNWLLVQEGQTIVSKGFGAPSLRKDVSTEGFNPLFKARPGQKVFVDTEDSILFRGPMVTIAKQIIEESGK